MMLFPVTLKNNIINCSYFSKIFHYTKLQNSTLNDTSVYVTSQVHVVITLLVMTEC